MIDDRLYSEKDLKELLPVEVISEIPDISTPGEEGTGGRSPSLGWAATGLEFVLIRQDLPSATSGVRL